MSDRLPMTDREWLLELVRAVEAFWTQPADSSEYTRCRDRLDATLSDARTYLEHQQE